MAYYPELSAYLPNYKGKAYVKSLLVEEKQMTITITKLKKESLKFKTEGEFVDKYNPALRSFLAR